ncbi:hypothetical protein SipoB123_41850 [Streptomyces ipomoeae]|nr:hypothetical protein SipoB123_41850 [Streptomyces ipomoeae]
MPAAPRPERQRPVPDRDHLLERSLHAIRTLRGELDQERARRAEPIAVTGLACRFPGGADTPERFWKLLDEGRDAVGPVPVDRWPDRPFPSGRPGPAGSARGGFLGEDIDAFDAAFFGLSKGEAAAMDPQHKLLLETGWEALERAGLLTGRPGSGRVGVFVGVSGSDHARVPVQPEHVGSFTAIGAAPSMAAGRVAHALGLHGPALAVDTACSSSLVAVHLAVESLRRGECDAAVAGGVNVMLSPDVFVVLDEMQALSPHGRCQVFDASADGYVRAEGCGAVALTRLTDAVAARLPVHAVIRASAVNHDGGAGGLTVPNGRAQRALLRSALAGAGLRGDAVGYLEAHGTGTPLGDPIEVGAAAEVLCADRPEGRSLRLGAVKSNIGHLEAAAGIAGLIKTVLVLRHGRIPANLHLREPNPRLGVERLPVILPRRPEPWPADGTPRIAGVSSFGFSGTNAHVVLEGADTAVPAPSPSPAPSRATPPAARLLSLSAASPAALAALTRRTAAWVRDHPGVRLADLARTLGAHRRHFRHRAALVTDREGPDLAALLDDLADRCGTPTPYSGSVPGARHIGLFLDATPQQALAAAAALRVSHGGFGALLDECAERLRLPGGAFPARLPESAEALTPLAADAVTLVFQVALSRLLADRGVHAAAVGGSGGAGDLAAAVVAEALDLPTAGALLTARHGGPVPASVRCRPPAARLLRDGGGETVPRNRLADPEFWCDPASRSAKEASAAAAGLAEREYGLFIAVGGPSPEPALTGPWWRIAHRGDVVGELLEGLAMAYRAGVDLDWAAVHGEESTVCLDLPAYPFQRRRHAPPVPRAEAVAAEDPATRRLGGAIALRVLSSPLEHAQFRATLSRAVLPQLADTGGVLHVGYYQEMLAAAATELDGVAGHELRDAEFTHALHTGGRARTVQLTLSPRSSGGGRSCTVHSLAEGEAEWTLHLRGGLGARGSAADPAAPWDGPEGRDEFLARLPEHVDGTRFYADLRARGLAFGPSVEWIEEAWYGDGEAVARLRAPEPAEAGGDSGADGHGGVLPVPAGVFDACAQLYVLAAGDRLAADDVFLTSRISRFTVLGRRPDRGPLWVRFTLTDEPADDTLTADYRLWDDAGHLVAECDGAAVRRIDAARARAAQWHAAAAEGAPEGRSPARRDVVDRFLKASGELRPHILGAYLRTLLEVSDDAAGLGRPPGRPLAEIGVDSLRGLELRGRLRTDLGVEPPLDGLLHGTTADLVGTLAGLLAGDGPPRPGRAVSNEPARWLRHARLTDTARVRLFCLPYGGRGASLFSTWPDTLPDDIDVCPLQLPGRENRRDEKCVEDADEMLDALEGVLRAHADRPFALYGHSVGGLLAYRLARRLAPTHGDRLRHLFVAAFSSPSRGANPLLSRITGACQELGLPDLPTAAELLRQLRTRPKEFHSALAGRLGEDVATSLCAAAEQALFADLRLVHTYRHDPDEPPLRVPVTALHGKSDPLVTEDDMRAWERATEGRFRLEVLSGDHYFCHPDQALDRVLRLITERIR